MIEVAARVDGWQSFPIDPIERARAALAAQKAGDGDASLLDFIADQEAQIQSLTLGNGTKYRLGWPDHGVAQSEWFTCPREAIRAAMQQQSKGE
jgi:hypothetical protein